MLTSLKRVCAFYLDRWWLPPICIPIWVIAAIHFGTPVFRIAVSPQSVASEVCGTAFIILLAEIGLFVSLGVPVSWIWLLFHKHGFKALWNVLLTVLIFSIPFLLFYSLS